MARKKTRGKVGRDRHKKEGSGRNKGGKKEERRKGRKEENGRTPITESVANDVLVDFARVHREQVRRLHRHGSVVHHGQQR